MITKIYALSDIGEFAIHFDAVTGAHCTGALEGDFLGVPMQRIVGSKDPNAKQILVDVVTTDVLEDLEDDVYKFQVSVQDSDKGCQAMRATLVVDVPWNYIAEKEGK